jgi:hypothetical protein
MFGGRAAAQPARRRDTEEANERMAIMKRMGIVLLATVWTCVVTAEPAVAQASGTETHVEVHVRAHDAKLIGDAVGGAFVTITETETGKVLASGVTTGGTGDTHLIIRSPHERYGNMFDTPGAAGFEAIFRLTRPTEVEVSAVGPLDYPQATVRASKTLLLEPGANIGGNGIVLDLQGLIVEVLDAPQASVDDGVAVRARVRMLCSCATEPGSLWTVERITARLMDGNDVVAEAPLEYSGQTSVYTGTVRASQPGAYMLVVAAADTDGDNFGIVTRPVSVK